MDPKKVEKFLRREQEREQHAELITTASAEMHNKGASTRSIHIALTGLHEYMQVTAAFPEPAPPGSPSNFTHIPVAGGFFLSDIPSRPLQWLWQDRLPRAALTLLEGDPGIGASLLTLDLAACVSSGHPMPDGSPGTQGTVILVAPHDHITHTIKPRLEAAGGDPSRVFLLTSVEDVTPKNGQLFYRPFSLAEDLHLLAKIVTRTKAVLVIIDTLDLCHLHQCQQALPPLTQLAEDTGCAVLLTRPRTTSRPGQDSPVRSTAPLDLRASVSSSLLIAADPADTHQRFLITTRHPLTPRPSTLCDEILGAAGGPPFLNWLGEAEHPDANAEGLSGALSITSLMILAILKECTEALSAREVSQYTGEEYERVRKALRRLFHAGQVVSPARGLYTLPGHPCLAQYPSPADPYPATEAQNPPVPGVPSSLATPGSENDPGADSQTTPVPGVSTVPTQPPAATCTPPIPRRARYTAPADVESEDESESSPDQQPHTPVRPNPPRFPSMEEDEEEDMEEDES
jgi:hypothetical protein